MPSTRCDSSSDAHGNGSRCVATQVETLNAWSRRMDDVLDAVGPLIKVAGKQLAERDEARDEAASVS